MAAALKPQPSASFVLAFSLASVVLATLLVWPFASSVWTTWSKRPPLLLAPMMDLTPCLLSDGQAAQDPTSEGSLKNCRGPQGSAAEWVHATLSTLHPPSSPSTAWTLGYTLKVPLLHFVTPSPKGWQVDTTALDKVVQTIEQTGKPLVLYMFSTHFSVDAPAETLLAQNPDNQAHTRDGVMPVDTYYGQPIYPWSVARTDNPITSARETVIRALQERLCARPASVRQHIQAITLLGEVHHLFPAFESGMGFSGSYRVSDYSASSQSAFQAFLQQRHGSVARFNKALGSQFAQWTDILPPAKDIRQEKLQHFFEHQDSFASGRLPLTGWVHLPSGSTSDTSTTAPSTQVHVFVNGRLVAQTPVALSRQDVLTAKPELGHANVGWRHDLDYSTWPSGVHRIDLAVRQGHGALHHLATRQVAIGNRQQQALQTVPSQAAPPFLPLPADAQAYTDEPRDLASYYYNPLAREWLAFRESQVQAYLQHFNRLFDTGCLANTPRYSHQIVPNFNPGWDADKFAVTASLRPQTKLQLGVSLYGETSYGPSFTHWLRQNQHTRYGITEFHPLRAMPPAALSGLLQRHHAQGAQFLSFFMDTPVHTNQGTGLNLFSLGQHNPQHASDQLFLSLQQVLQSPPDTHSTAFSFLRPVSGNKLPIKP